MDIPAAMTLQPPRGKRNHNPGDLRGSTAYTWQGQVGIDDDGFVIFEDDFHGIRALSRTLRTSMTLHGRDTVPAIITAWAPPWDDNDTEAYINAVCARTAFGRCEVLTPCVHTIRALTVAIIWQEIGEFPYTEDLVSRAVRAGVGGEGDCLR